MADEKPLITPEHRALVDAFSDAMRTGSREAGAKAEADKQAAAKAEEASQRLKQMNEALRSSVLDMTKNFAAGGEGLSKFGGSVTGAADGVGNFVGKLGPLGFVIGGLIKIFGQVAAASLKQNDALMKSYRELAEAGSVSGSLEQLRDDLHKVGLTSEEAEKFGAMLKKNAPELAAFGGSVTAGKEKLLGVIQGMIGPNNEIERAMAHIGYGAEEMRDATADYIAKQAKLGLSQAKTEAELRQESSKYMVTLRELQELTGMSRDEAQKLMDQQMSEYRYNEYLRQLELSGKKEEAANLRSYMASYEKTFGKQNANDLMEQIVNKGAAVGEASTRAMLSTQNKGYENAMKAQKGQIDMYDGLKDTAAGMRRNMNQLGVAYNQAGQQIGTLTGSNEGLIGMQMMEGKTRQEVQKKLKEAMNTEKDRLDTNVKTEQEARALRIAADKGIYEVGNMVVSMFEKLTRAMFGFGKGLAKIIDTISSKIPGMGQTHLSDAFRDADDVASDLESTRQSRAAIAEDLIATKAKLEATEAEIGKQLDIRDKANEQIKIKQKEINDLTANLSTMKGEDRRKAYMDLEVKKKELAQAEHEKKKSEKEFNLAEKDAALQKQRKQILDNEQKLQAEDKRIQELEKEQASMEATPSSRSAATSSATGGGKGGGAPLSAAKNMEGNRSLTTEITSADGKKEVRQGGTISWRNNNPGNLRDGKYSREYGSIGTAGGFAVFPDMATGEKARERLLFESDLYKGLSIGSAISKYAPSSENNTRAYIQQILNATGAKETTAMAELTPEQRQAMLAAMKQHEGFKEGTIKQAHGGGVFDGPDSGYPVMLHGNEAVIPMPNMGDFIKDVKKESLAALSNTQVTNQNTVTQPSIDMSGLEKLIVEVMATKFDDMISHLDSANDTLSNILKHAKA
jgi:hypothetical protein